MTLVAAFSGVWGGILIADSRITISSGGAHSFKDVFQKVVPLPHDYGWIGFAGDVNTATKFLNAATSYTDRYGISWLSERS